MTIDLTNLRGMTGGDKELEKELFKEFVLSGDKLIAELKKSLADNYNESWCTVSHGFKGIALNLGAENLSELCKKAQMNDSPTNADKQSLLTQIELEYNKVKELLGSL